MLNAVIDLSHHNELSHKNDPLRCFQEAQAAGILGVIHKATEGTGMIDGDYAKRRQPALDAGLMWGAYHFGVPGNATGQADHFLDVVQPVDKDLIVLDFESRNNKPAMSLAEAEAFVDHVFNKTGRFPGLYSGQSFLKDQLDGVANSILSNCFLWIARYSSKQPEIPDLFPTFTLWQYTDGNVGPDPHEVPGIGHCDREKFNGDEAGLKRLWGY